jgi:O-antigen/teichoic acid export membrane protein
VKAFTHAQHVLVNRLAMPVGAFVLLIVIGLHSDELLGQYALVMTFYFIMQMIPLLGLTSYVMREVAREPAAAGRYLTTIGALSMAGCVIVDAAAWGLLRFLNYPREVNQAIGIVGLLIYPGILVFIAEILFMSVQRARPVAVVAVWENVARAAISVALIWMDGGLVALFVVFFATRVTALAAYLVVLRRTGIVPRWEPLDIALLKRTLILLPSFLAGTLLLAVFSRLDFLVLSLYQPVESIGYYAIGYRPFEIGIMMLTALLMAIFPKVSRVFARTPRQYSAWSRHATLGFAAALAMASLGGVLIAPEYVYLLFSQQYPRPVPLTQLYMASLIIAGLDFVFGALLHASDRQQSDARAMLLGGLAQLALLFALIPTLGLYGAVAAKVIATLVQASVKWLLLRRAFGPILAPGDGARVAVIGALLALAAWTVLDASWPVRWLAAIILSFAVLPALCLAFGLLQPLRLLRFYWRQHRAREPQSIADLLDLAVADAREHAQLRHRRPTRMDRGLAAVLLYRLARHFHLNRRTRTAGVVRAVARAFTRREIDPSSPERPALRGT